jgi:hypothetical protein
MKTTKGFAPILIVLLIAVVVGGGSYYAVNKNKADKRQANVEVDTQATTTTSQATSTGKNNGAIVPGTPPQVAWKTYSNAQFGFEIKYPSNWKVEEQTNPFKVRIYDIKNPGKQDTDQPSNQIVITERSAICSTADWAGGSEIANYKQACHVAGLTLTAQSISQASTDIENQIIATFKSTKPAQVNWKTYMNSQAGFSFKYPETFKIDNSPQYPPNTFKADNQDQSSNIKFIHSSVLITNIPFDQYANEIIASIIPGGNTLNAHKTTVAGRQALVVEQVGYPSRIPSIDTYIDLSGGVVIDLNIYGVHDLKNYSEAKTTYPEYKVFEDLNKEILSSFTITK